MIDVEQVKINAAFYTAATGETGVTTAVSRTHKAKHHINTLAIQVSVKARWVPYCSSDKCADTTAVWLFQALERENDLLEGRSKQMLTKAQTQGRYGW